VKEILTLICGDVFTSTLIFALAKLEVFCEGEIFLLVLIFGCRVLEHNSQTGQ
jgi:hypothetical protein